MRVRGDGLHRIVPSFAWHILGRWCEARGTRAVNRALARGTFADLERACRRKAELRARAGKYFSRRRGT